MDSSSTYFTNDLDLEMFKTSMSPMTPTLDSQDQFGTSNEMNWNLNGDFSYSPDAYFGDESYDYFGFPSDSGPLAAQGFDAGFGTKNSGNDLMDWSTTIGTTAPTFTVPLAPSFTNYSSGSYLSSPELGSFNEEFISPAALGTETDTESLTSSKRGADETSATSASESSRPSKKQCSSKASSSSKATVTKAPKEKSASKSKSKSSKSSSKSASSSASAAPSTSGHGGNHNIQLRTASRKPKSPTSTSPADEDDDDDEALTNEEKRARQSHNAVEKQYRNRLNMQFERLLAVLPADQQAEARDRHHIKGSGSSDGDDKRMSKAEVLDMARRRIRALEEERLALQEERKGLIENVSEMQRAAVRQRMQMVGQA